MGVIYGVCLLLFLGTSLGSHIPDAEYQTFELTSGSLLTSPSLATSGVISSLTDTSLITCCMKCTRIGQCAGIFYDSAIKLCKHYSFKNYTSMTIVGIQNFVKIISECEKQGHVLSIRYGLCFDLLTNTFPWNKSRDACHNDDGQLVTLDTEPKIQFMTDYIGHIYPDAQFWHVGASNENTDEDWIWPNGAPVTDILSTRGIQSACSALNRKKTKIQVVECETSRRRICEWPYLI